MIIVHLAKNYRICAGSLGEPQIRGVFARRELFREGNSEERRSLQHPKQRSAVLSKA